MIKEGYRHYDCPVAMPGEAIEIPQGITLEEYFANLNKLHDKEETVQSKQVGGTHYQKEIQPWDIISVWGLDYWAGDVVKYILRYKYKNGVEDLKKAKHYLEYLIERTENGN